VVTLGQCCLTHCLCRSVRRFAKPNWDFHQAAGTGDGCPGRSQVLAADQPRPRGRPHAQYMPNSAPCATNSQVRATPVARYETAALPAELHRPQGTRRVVAQLAMNADLPVLQSSKAAVSPTPAVQTGGRYTPVSAYVRPGRWVSHALNIRRGHPGPLGSCLYTGAATQLRNPWSGRPPRLLVTGELGGPADPPCQRRSEVRNHRRGSRG
jgi:hypothetical protein